MTTLDDIVNVSKPVIHGNRACTAIACQVFLGGWGPRLSPVLPPPAHLIQGTHIHKIIHTNLTLTLTVYTYTYIMITRMAAGLL